MNQDKILIGIDPGVKTGVAVWNQSKQRFESIETMKIHEAMKLVEKYAITNVNRLSVHFEDARQRKWFGNSGREQLQGAGSIKRDCSIWEHFLADEKVDYCMIPPKRITTKLSDVQFKRLTKWSKRTSEHSRDASMIVYGY